MKNMPRKDEPQNSKLAQFIASIPLPVWYAFFTLLVALIVLSVAAQYFPHTGMAAFMDGLLAWIVRILLVSGVVIAVRLLYAAALMVSDVATKALDLHAAHQRKEKGRLQNNLLEEQVKAAKELTALLKGAVERGSNVKVNGIEISNWRSNLRQIEGQGVVESSPPERIAPPVEVRQIEGPSIKICEVPIPANDMLSTRKLFAGISGSGKSNTVGTYVEALGELNVPLLLADTEDEYQPLCNELWLPSGMLAGKTGANSVIPDNAYQFGRYILQEMKQVILNLQSYDEMEEAALVMIGIIAGMREWQEERENERRIPGETILEEGPTWLPQNVKESPLHGSETFNRLQSTFFNDLVRKGRKRGLGITVVCQRIAEIDKRALQCDVKILHRQSEPTDLQVYEKMGIDRAETMALRNGDAFLFTSSMSKQRVHVRRRSSPHGGNTPGLEQLQRYQSTRKLDERDSELWRTLEPSNVVRPQFGKPVEPVRNSSDIAPNSTKSAQRDIPPELRTEIIARYRKGRGRKKIQEELHIAGDQFWQLRDICDAVDAEQQKAESEG